MGLSFPSRLLQIVACFPLIVSAALALSFQTEKTTESKNPQSIQVDVNLVTVGVHVTDQEKDNIWTRGVRVCSLRRREGTNDNFFRSKGATR